MISFNDLPDEVIDQVCIHLRNSCSGRRELNFQPATRIALARLSRTSRRLRQIALPHLYHYININDYDARLVTFTKSLVDNPAFAKWVRAIDLDMCGQHMYDGTVAHCFSKLPSGRYYTGAGLDDAEMRSIDSQSFFITRSLQLLLTRLENLESIDLTLSDDQFETECFSYIQRMHSKDPHFMRQLKEVTLRQYDTESGFILESVIPLLSFPTSRLTLFQCIGTSEDQNCPMPSLLELRIFDSGLDQSDFKRLVRWCPNLQLLHYEVGAAHVTNYCDDLATAYDITYVLAPLNSSLRTLSLHEPYHEPSEGVSMSPLTKFSKLENLTVDMYVLADGLDGSIYSELEDEVEESYRVESLTSWLHKLPSSLQTLSILQTAESLEMGFSELAARAPTDFPNLKSVVVDQDLGLGRLFRGTGIKYQELSIDSIPNGQGDYST